MVDILALANDRYTSLFVALAALLVLVLVLGAGLWYYRRRWLLSESQSDAQPWTLADLRRLKEAGDLTEEEYQRVRAAMIAGFGSDSAPSEASSRPVGPVIPPDKKAGF